jgi:transcriptional regulator with XRE-family HTH domain
MNTEMTGQLIAERRRELGLSQTELAEQLHVTDKAVSRWETGRGMPAVDSLEPLAEVLGLSVSELLSGKRLTAEELPRAAGGQIVEGMRKNARMVWQGVLSVLLILAIAVGFRAGCHWFTSAPETDIDALTKQAAEYLLVPRRAFTPEADPDTLRIVELERRGDYLTALCVDDQSNWCMCVYVRDRIFENRWRSGGGKPSLTAGELGSWNFGNSREAVIIFCGGDLPEDAAYYTFRNSGITYTCPIQDRQVLDIFLLPDTRDISSYPEILMDQNGEPLEGAFEGESQEETPDESSLKVQE